MATDKAGLARNRMYDRLSEKMSKVVGHRGDMYIADYQPITKKAGKLLIGYAKHLGIISSNDIRAFVIREFEGKALPDLSTARVHKMEGAISLVVKMFQPTKKLEAKEKMLAVAATMFLDQELGDTWEVKDKDGAKFLAKVTKEDLNDIVKARRQRMQIKSSPISLASVDGGIPAELHNGDKVSYYYDNERQTGVILNVAEADVKIKNGDKVHTVAKNSVLEVNEISPDESKKLDTQLYEYFRTIYGDEYAKLLTTPETPYVVEKGKGK